MKLDSLHKLYVQELQDLYSAENQLLQALPRMEAAASNPELKQAFHDHLDDTRSHLERLEQIFKKLGIQPAGHRCCAMYGLMEESSELLHSDIDPQVLDAALIAVAQRVEHYEIAGYGTVRTFAEQLGEYYAADTLQLTLNEAAHNDQLLTRLAERSVNFLATTAIGG